MERGEDEIYGVSNGTMPLQRFDTLAGMRRFQNDGSMEAGDGISMERPVLRGTLSLGSLYQLLQEEGERNRRIDRERYAYITWCEIRLARVENLLNEWCDHWRDVERREIISDDDEEFSGSERGSPIPTAETDEDSSRSDIYMG